MVKWKTLNLVFFRRIFRINNIHAIRRKKKKQQLSCHNGQLLVLQFVEPFTNWINHICKLYLEHVNEHDPIELGSRLSISYFQIRCVFRLILRIAKIRLNWNISYFVWERKKNLIKPSRQSLNILSKAIYVLEPNIHFIPTMYIYYFQ